MIRSSFYDLTADAGWETSRRVSGYDIKFEVISGLEQLMLIIASGEPYDYIYLTPANYARMMSEGALLDITDLLAKYGDNITGAITNLWPSTTVDGRIYAIPSTVAQPDSLPLSIVVRQDLLDKADIKMANTVEEFYEMLKAVKKAYPNLIPLTLDGTSSQDNPGGYFIHNVAAGFGMTGYWQLIDNNVVPIIKHPQLKPYLEYMIKLYKEGLIDVEMPALENKDMNAKFSSGRAVMMKSTWNGIETIIGALRANVPTLEYSVVPILTDNKGNALVEKRIGVGAFGGIPVTAKHPEDAIKAINNMIQMDNFTEIALGIEGVHYTKDGDKYALIQPAFNDERVNSNVFISGFYREDIYPKMWEARLSKNADLEWIFNAYKASIKDFGVYNPVGLAPAVTVVDNKAALDDYVRDGLVNIVAGAAPLSSLDTLIRYWDANGGKEIEKFYNDWYAGI